MADNLDPFAPENLRADLSQYGSATRQIYTTILCKKPERQWFVRAHADPAFRMSPVNLIEFKDEREVYLVTPQMQPELNDSDYSTASLFLAVNRQGVPFIWPCKLPTGDRRGDTWGASAHAAAEIATKRWIRVTANMSAGSYEVFEALGKIPDPTWPELPMNELLRICFKDRLVDTVEHAVIQRLRGAL